MRQPFVAGLLALVLAPGARAQGVTEDESPGWSEAAGPTAVTTRAGNGVTLVEVLRAVASHHPLVQKAGALLTAAEGARRAAGALDNPTLNGLIENAPLPGQASQPGLDRETSVFLTLPLEWLYQRGPRVRRADQEVEAGHAALMLARRTVALEAAQAYYRVAAAQVAVRSAEDVRASLESLAAFNRSRVAEGATAEGELIRVEVELDRAGTSLALEHIELAHARAELRAFLGQGPDAIQASDGGPVVSEDLGKAWAVPCAFEDFVMLARGVRPDLSEARARVAASRAEVEVQRRLAVPVLGASFGVKRIGDDDTMIAGLGLSLPIFNRNRGQIQAAGAELAAAEHDLAWKEQRAMAEIEGAYQATRLLTEQMDRLAGSFLGRAEESQRITIAAYQEGATGLLQVLDATRTLADVRLLYYRTVFSQRRSFLELATAAGVDALDALADGLTCTPAEHDEDGQR